VLVVKLLKIKILKNPILIGNYKEPFHRLKMDFGALSKMKLLISMR